MNKAIIGRKPGMTQIFTAEGKVIIYIWYRYESTLILNNYRAHSRNVISRDMRTRSVRLTRENPHVVSSELFQIIPTIKKSNATISCRP